MSKELLIKKIRAEEEAFIKAMLLRSPAEIIEAAYEITYRKEIICILETSYFSEEEIEKILSLPDALSDLYYYWLDWDGDCLKEAIEDYFKN